MIARAGLMSFLSRRAFLGLLIVAWIPFVVRASQLFLASNFSQAATFLAPSAQTFRDFLGQQSIFVFLITVYVGAGLIANDRRANALQLYLSKPVTRAEYILGKMTVLATFLLGITWLPAILLLIFQIAFSGSFSFLKANASLIASVTLYCLLTVIVITFGMTALSSLSRSSRFVGILFAGVLIFSDAMFNALALHHRIVGDFVGVDPGKPRPGGRRHLPTGPAAPDAGGRVVPGAAGGHRHLGVGAGAARARRRGGGMSAAIITADHVSKWYGQVIGLNDVSVTIPAGITGLLGPNGAGKSTFMKLITGQLKPSKGEMTVLGESIWNNPAAYTRIGFCPEQDSFYERMTGLEWVSALVRLNGYSSPEARQAALRALESVDLVPAADKKIGAYSKGMRQRVKLAQALVHDPDLLILDEPLTGMDPLMRRRTIRIIREWARDGRSVLVSSHILHEVEAMTSNVLLINNGRILAEGDVHDIRGLIDNHPHTVHIRAERPRELARECLSYAYVRSLRFESEALVVETDAPDTFYTQVTALAATETFGRIEEVTSPDDNLAAVFGYLVK